MPERSACDGRPFPCVFGVDGVAAVVLLVPAVATTGAFGVKGVMTGAMGFVSAAIGVSGEAGGGSGSACL